MFKPTHDALLELIGAAIAAPSADNRHHVLFRILDDALEIVTDEVYEQCAEVHRRHLTLLSFGAVVENIRLWLAARGWYYVPDWFPSSDDPRLLVRIVWTSLLAAHAEPDSLAAHIDSRHTNRNFFTGPPATPAERDAIDRCFNGQEAFRLEWFDAPTRRQAVLQLIRRAETFRFRQQRHHDELFGSVDFDAGWSAATTERLAPGSLEIEAPLRPFFKALRHWPVMRAVNRIGAAQVLGLRAGDLPCRLSPHLAAIVTRTTAPRAFLDGGALFQRVWLAAQSLGLALQPMAASVILIDEPGLDAAPGVRFREGWDALTHDGSVPVMVFRLGHARPIRVRSLRRPVQTYLVDSADTNR